MSFYFILKLLFIYLKFYLINKFLISLLKKIFIYKFIFIYLIIYLINRLTYLLNLLLNQEVFILFIKLFNIKF